MTINNSLLFKFSCPWDHPLYFYWNCPVSVKTIYFQSFGPPTFSSVSPLQPDGPYPNWPYAGQVFHNSINDVLKWNFWMSVKSNTLQPRCSNGSHGSRDKRRNFLYVTMVQNTLKIRFWIGNGSAHRINKISPASLIRKWPSRLP